MQTNNMTVASVGKTAALPVGIDCSQALDTHSSRLFKQYRFYRALRACRYIQFDPKDMSAWESVAALLQGNRLESVYRLRGTDIEPMFPASVSRKVAALAETCISVDVAHYAMSIAKPTEAEWGAVVVARYTLCEALATIPKQRERDRFLVALNKLHTTFKLPRWRRIYLDYASKTAGAEPEYPGWLVNMAQHV